MSHFNCVSMCLDVSRCCLTMSHFDCRMVSWPQSVGSTPTVCWSGRRNARAVGCQSADDGRGVRSGGHAENASASRGCRRSWGLRELIGWRSRWLACVRRRFVTEFNSTVRRFGFAIRAGVTTGYNGRPATGTWLNQLINLCTLFSFSSEH